MDFFGRLKCSAWPGRLWVLTVLLAAACGGGASSSQESAGTSALSFQVVWDRPGFQAASLTDCADVATVEAAVYSDAGDLLGAGGPWDCLTGSGVIAGLPANYYATIVVAGNGPDGTPLYSGQSATFFLNPGSVDGGVITAGPFVPQLLSPNAAAIVDPGALTLRWAGLDGAAGYRVTLATNDSFAAETIVGAYTIGDGAATTLQPDVAGLQMDVPFYWHVQAVRAGRPGAPSTMRQFSLRQVVVTSVTFVGDDPAGVVSPVETTVAFSYATIDFSQQRDGAVIDQWSAPLDSTDYFALQEIITSYELMGQSDITVTSNSCTGWSGLAVSMVYNAANYGFAIAPAVCNPAEWPTGVSSLVTLKDDLVAEYQP
ncbi:MAG: hypothetical protein HY911_03595 [Desulfobacterales bacterium]|nr:hypothetical protein [Desulfobacterales bacterium]